MTGSETVKLKWKKAIVLTSNSVQPLTPIKIANKRVLNSLKDPSQNIAATPQSRSEYLSPTTSSFKTLKCHKIYTAVINTKDGTDRENEFGNHVFIANRAIRKIETSSKPDDAGVTVDILTRTHGIVILRWLIWISVTAV